MTDPAATPPVDPESTDPATDGAPLTSAPPIAEATHTSSSNDGFEAEVVTDLPTETAPVQGSDKPAGGEVTDPGTQVPNSPPPTAPPAAQPDAPAPGTPAPATQAPQSSGSISAPAPGDVTSGQ